MDYFLDGIVSCNKARGDICINAGKWLLMFDKGTNDTSLFFNSSYSHFHILMFKRFSKFSNWINSIRKCFHCFSLHEMSFTITDNFHIN